jgi:hypothetical protein
MQIFYGEVWRAVLRGVFDAGATDAPALMRFFTPEQLALLRRCAAVTPEDNQNLPLTLW